MFFFRFEQNRGVITSKDYSGYRLSLNQQLAEPTAAQTAPSCPISAFLPGHTLPEFTQYLVLERMEERISSHTSSCARRPDVLVGMGDLDLDLDLDLDRVEQWE